MKDNILTHVINKIQQSNLCLEPSLHFEFSNILPSDVYEEVIQRFPLKEHFQPLMHQDAMMKDGGSSRGEIYLNPTGLAKLSPDDREFWLTVGDVFCSDILCKTLQDKLRLDGDLVAKPSLYQDRSGYQIRPHTDIYTKAITMQIYLPIDTKMENYGTTFYSKIEEHFVPAKRISFIPNKGYAFPVSNCSWHGVEKIDAPNVTRNSLMIIFYHQQYLTEAGDINFVDPKVMR